MIRFIVALLCIFCLGSSCTKWPPSAYYTMIPVQNLTEDTLYVYPSTGHIHNYLTSQRVLSENPILQCIPPGSTITLNNFRVYHERDYQNNEYKRIDEDYQLMVYRSKTLKNYTKDYLIENNVYDKLYVLTYDELEAMGFKVIYHGD